MWQNIIVYAILALVAGFTLFSFYRKFTGKSTCCGGGCTCKEACGPGKAASRQDQGGDHAHRCASIG